MSVTRRRFLVALPAAGAALVFCARSGAEAAGGAEAGFGALNANATNARDAAGQPEKRPVVSFHLDQPYLDLTGLEEPYVPPAGLRSGAALAAFSEEEMLGRFYGFI